MYKELHAELKRQLEGRKIRHVISISAKTQRDVFSWHGNAPAFALELDDGTYVSVLADAEGNGPGHLDIFTPGA